MDVEFTRHRQMVSNEDGSQMHEHLFVMARTVAERMPYFYWIDAGRSEIEDDPYFAPKLEQFEKLAEMGLRRYIDEHPAAALTVGD